MEESHEKYIWELNRKILEQENRIRGYELSLEKMNITKKSLQDDIEKISEKEKGWKLKSERILYLIIIEKISQIEALHNTKLNKMEDDKEVEISNLITRYEEKIRFVEQERAKYEEVYFLLKKLGFTKRSRKFKFKKKTTSTNDINL